MQMHEGTSGNAIQQAMHALPIFPSANSKPLGQGETQTGSLAARLGVLNRPPGDCFGEGRSLFRLQGSLEAVHGLASTVRLLLLLLQIRPKSTSADRYRAVSFLEVPAAAFSELIKQ